MWTITISRFGVLKVRAFETDVGPQVKVAADRNSQGFDLGPTSASSCPRALLGHCAFVVKSESKDYQIAAKMRRPD
jgi:hypothetical protein